jgi:hypothetical protein
MRREERMERGELVLPRVVKIQTEIRLKSTANANVVFGFLRLFFVVFVVCLIIVILRYLIILKTRKFHKKLI